MKSPRLSFNRYTDSWRCNGLGISTDGETKEVAYYEWLKQAVDVMTTKERLDVFNVLLKRSEPDKGDQK